MKNINKVFILFIFIVAALFVVTWEFIQSDFVANKVSNVITIYAKQYLDVELEFDDIQFHLFPPGVSVKDVDVAIESDVNTHFKAKQLSAFFKPRDVISTDLIISEVKIQDLKLNIKNNKTKNTKKSKARNLGNIDIFDKVLGLPVRVLTVQNYGVSYEGYSLQGGTAIVDKKRDRLNIEGQIRSVKGVHEQLVDIDDIKTRLEWYGNKLEIKKMSVFSGFSKIEINGRINNLFNQAELKLSSSIRAPLKRIEAITSLNRWGEIESGTLEGNVDITGVYPEIVADGEVQIKNAKSSFVYLKSLDISFNVNREMIKVGELKAVDYLGGEAKTSDVVLYDLQSEKVLPNEFKVKAKELSASTFLYYIKNKTDFLNFKATGTIGVKIKPKETSFIAEESLHVDDLEIRTGEKTRLFKFKNGIDLSRATVILNDGVYLDLAGINQKTEISVGGEIAKDTTNVNIKVDKLELEDITPFAGEAVSGVASTQLTLKEQNGLKLSGHVHVDKFLLRNTYGLDKLESALELDLNLLTLNLREIKGELGKAVVAASIDYNLARQELKGEYDLKNITSNSILNFLNITDAEIKKKSDELIGNFFTSGEINAKFRAGIFHVRGSASSNNFTLYNEEGNKLNLSYEVDNEKLRINRYELSRGRSKAYGSINWKYKENLIQLENQFEDFKITEMKAYSKVPLDVEFQINGPVEIIKNKKSYTVKSNLVLSDTKTINTNYRDSQINVDYQSEKLKVNASMLGEQITFKLNLDNNKNKVSEIEINTDISDISKFSKIFSAVDKFDNPINGFLNAELKAKFNYEKWEIADMVVNFKRIYFNKNEIVLSYENPVHEVIISNKKIKKWDIDIRGENVYLQSRAGGNVSTSLSATTYLKVNASVLEVFSGLVNKAAGVLRGKFVVDQKLQDYKVSIDSRDLEFDFKKSPVNLTAGEIKLVYDDFLINIEKVSAKVGSGTVGLAGKIDFKNVFPKVELEYMINDAVVPVLNRSQVTVRGSGEITGVKFPYLIGGDLYLKNFVLINELNEFENLNSKTVKKSPYLPERAKRKKNQILNLDLNVQTQDPIYIKNSLANIAFKGEVKVMGGENEVFLDGGVSLYPRKNYIKIKNTEFQVNKAFINFNSEKSSSNPDIDFETSGRINNYNISIKSVSEIKDFKLEFSSEPALSQNDILSLIAFGYTEDVSKDLSNSERESLTQAGVGAIIFDRFKINETLEKEFGLQINLGTEITQDSGSYLSRRGAEGDNSERKTKSSTTFEVSKKLTDKVDLSVSSTIGGSATQKQSMNLNYNMTNNFSLEGVYESKNDDDAESVDDDTSIGADLKWRWSFK